ncbi:MAG: hemerythrin domain-containing protein [Bacteroidota bacterium]
MNKHLKPLYDEHDIIVQAAEIARQAGPLALEDGERYASLIRELTGFFRQYADSYHHYKEELILFPEMSRKNELLLGGVVGEMLENHTDFREMLGAVVKFLDRGEHQKARQQLDYYLEALLDHIAVENDEVFPMAETLFSEQELEKLSHRFDDCDRELGTGKKDQWQDLVRKLRKEYTLNI